MILGAQIKNQDRREKLSLYTPQISEGLAHALANIYCVGKELLRNGQQGSSFISISKLAGMNNVAVELLCGHTVSVLDSAYSQFSLEELRNLYKKFEKHLSVTGMVDTEKIEALELKSQTLEQNSQNNQGVITALLENGKNKDLQIAKMTG